MERKQISFYMLNYEEQVHKQYSAFHRRTRRKHFYPQWIGGGRGQNLNPRGWSFLS